MGHDAPSLFPFIVGEAWPAAVNLPDWAMPALATTGILLGLWIILNQLRADRRARQPQRPGTPTAHSADAAPLWEVMRDAEELINRLAARADAQAQQLETLINRAALGEQRLTEVLRAAARLEAARDAARATPPAPVKPEAAPARPVAELKPVIREPARAVPDDSPHAEVYAMADCGLTPGEIAKRLGAPKGEIELILSLRQV